MYDPKVDATRPNERFAEPNETIFSHVRRVVNHYKDKQRQLVFDGMPQELQRDYPEIFGRLDTEQLGILCSLVWLYLEHPHINSLRKFFRDSVK